jgi:hypothetical protein
MTDLEFQVVTFINDRTLEYKKEWEEIPMRHFTKGVFSREEHGVMWHCPIPKSSRRIWAAIQGLRRKGFIEVAERDGCGANRYRLNLAAPIWEMTPLHQKKIKPEASPATERIRIKPRPGRRRPGAAGRLNKP